MYVTQKHICFYAYIPKKHHDVSKTGYLSKRGRSKFNRYWFVLKGDVLGYYTNPAELYYPRNRINLQYAISAEVIDPSSAARPTWWGSSGTGAFSPNKRRQGR